METVGSLCLTGSWQSGFSQLITIAHQVLITQNAEDAKKFWTKNISKFNNHWMELGLTYISNDKGVSNPDNRLTQIILRTEIKYLKKLN